MLEIAGASGMLAAASMPVLGIAAGVGLLLLLAGALVVHVNNGDGIREAAPAGVFAALVIAYIVVQTGLV